MNWLGLEDELENSFTECKLTVPEGRVLTPREAICVQDALWKYACSEGDQEQIEDEGIEGLICARWNMGSILVFEWDGFGPITWSLGLRTFEIRTGRSYICIVGEEECGGIKIVAALEPTRGARLFPPFFKDLLTDNGESYGCPLFNSLPTMTRNRQPDLLPTHVIRDAYMNWMAWSQLRGSQTWSDLVTYLRHVSKEPDHLKRVLAILHEMHSGRPPADHPDQAAPWYTAREKDRNKPYFQWERSAILELYFNLAYEVRRVHRPSVH